MKSLFVDGSAPALVNDVFILVQAISFQRAEDVGSRSDDGTRCVEVFDTHQPLALMVFGVEITAYGGYQ